VSATATASASAADGLPGRLDGSRGRDLPDAATTTAAADGAPAGSSAGRARLISLAVRRPRLIRARHD
jgi:hypothetical protein